LTFGLQRANIPG